MIFHSDQGSIYGSKVFCKTVQDYGLTQSMSRRGNCWDNAPMERWFRSFKYGSPTSLQSRFTAYFNKNNLRGLLN